VFQFRVVTARSVGPCTARARPRSRRLDVGAPDLGEHCAKLGHRQAVVRAQVHATKQESVAASAFSRHGQSATVIDVPELAVQTLPGGYVETFRAFVSESPATLLEAAGGDVSAVEAAEQRRRVIGARADATGYVVELFGG